MKIVAINMVADGSTGSIMRGIAEVARKKGHDVLTFSCPSFSFSHPEKFIPYEGHRYYGTRLDHALHYILATRTGKNGRYSVLSTLQLIRQIKKFGPDVIHLHNLHNFCLNFPLFFRFLKKSGIPVVWTLHDCWTMTGHCPNFDMIGCEKWIEGCHDCPQFTSYPESRKDRSKEEYLLKKKWFTSLQKLTLVTPSRWVKDVASKSFLKDFPAKLISNSIDLSAFYPTESDFRKKHKLENKSIVLGVSLGWSDRKGLDVFLDLARRLGENYQVVLVGTEVSQHPIPENIISIPRANGPKELAEIYTAADVFVNPTREEMFGLVNVEALACGTPLVTFRTGGTAEIPDENSGVVVEKNDIDAMEKEIRRICTEKPFSPENCIRRSKDFDKNKRFDEYVALYESVCEK